MEFCSGGLKFSHVIFSIHTFLYCVFFIIIGFNIIIQFLVVKLYAYNKKYIPQKISFNWNAALNENWFIFGGVFLIMVGIILSICALLYWKNMGYSQLIPEVTMRIAIPAVAMLELGIQSFFSGFFMGIIKIK